MKREGLLLPAAWSTKLPNYRFVDVEGKPTVTRDFTVPGRRAGSALGHGEARLLLRYGAAQRPAEHRPRRSAEWIAENPGRFTYPQPPDFIGTTFLKQLLVELAPDPAVLAEPATDANFDAATAPLFAWLDAAHPNLWRGGRAFPRDYGEPAPAPRRRRGRHRLRLQSRPTRRARSRTASCPTRCGASSSRRHARQHAFRGDPVQRQRRGRRDGAREFPDVAGGAGAKSRTRRSGATRRCSPSTSCRRRTARASPRSISASRRFARKSSGRRCPSRTLLGGADRARMGAPLRREPVARCRRPHVALRATFPGSQPSGVASGGCLIVPPPKSRSPGDLLQAMVRRLARPLRLSCRVAAAWRSSGIGYLRSAARLSLRRFASSRHAGPRPLGAPQPLDRASRRRRSPSPS